MPLSVVILAAGQGKRMKSDLPKVVQPLAGRPMLEHVVDCAHELGAAAIHVVYGHGGDRVRAALADASVQWVLQAEQLGTGHAVLQAMPGIPDDHTVLVLYGDVPLVRAATMRRLVEKAGERAIAVLTAMADDATGYGRVIRDTAGNVARIVEHKDAGRKELAVREINTGLLAAPAGALRRWLAALRNDNSQGEYYLTDCVVAAVRDGLRVEGVVSPTWAEVLGINDKVQLAEAETALRRWRAAELMLAGVTVVDPARLDVRGSVEHGRDVLLDVNVVLSGRIRLGDGVQVGPGCVLHNCELGAGTVVLPQSVLDGVKAGERCIIGPFARLRPGAQLADEVHVGNFVEIKKSTLGRGSKANHLTYLGDTTVGAKVNVGAGTITCNYDGVNKFPTVIGDGAFIGSGTMLVAPVEVGADATIGAGSTITKPAPAGKLTLERAKQFTVDSWKRPTRK